MCEGRPEDRPLFLCLGDAIDGPHGRATECIEFLYDLKLNYGCWDNIHLIAGNHEIYSDEIKRTNGLGEFFREVLIERSSYGDLGNTASETASFILDWHKRYHPNDRFEGDQLRIALARLFYWSFRELPRIALVGDVCFVHGGITDKGPFSWVNQASVFGRPPPFKEAIEWLMESRYDQATTEDLTWSDFRPDVERTRPNEDRCFDEQGFPVEGPGLLFGPRSLQAFLEVLGSRFMIRGHNANAPTGVDYHNGCVWAHGDNFMTINSARYRQYLEVDLSRTSNGLGSAKVLTI
jgi:hypothetical protein